MQKNAEKDQVFKRILNMWDEDRDKALSVDEKMLPLFRGLYFCPMVYALSWFPEIRGDPLNMPMLCLNGDFEYQYKDGKTEAPIPHVLEFATRCLE